MKTTELWIEQVLIGALGIAIALLPWLGELVVRASQVSTVMGLAGGSVMLGLAFWLGIPLDRLADTLTERLDHHARLRFALTRAYGEALPTADNLGRIDRDLYPEDRLRIAGLRDSDAAVEWLDYHRSRIRLTRALMLYGPALTLTLGLGLERLPAISSPTENLAWLGGIVAAYLLWALLVRIGSELPRTNEIGLIAYASAWGFVDANEEQRVGKTKTTDASVWAAEWRTLIAPVAILVAALLLAFSSPGPWVRAGVGAGIAITILSAWAWWRIGFTFRTYIYALNRYAKPA